MDSTKPAFLSIEEREAHLAEIARLRDEVETLSAFVGSDGVERLVAVAVVAEREACAQIAETCSGGDAETPKRDVIAARIRARKD